MTLRPPRTLLLSLLLLVPVAAPAGALAAPRADAPAVAPTDTLHLTLDDAVRRALAQGEEMRAAHAAVHQTEGQVLQELSRALPQVSATVTYDRMLHSIYEDMFSGASGQGLGSVFENTPFAARNTWTASLTAQQLLWSGGKVGAALRAAHLANRSAHATSDATAADLVYQVRQAYYDVSYARRLVEIAEGALAQARAHLQQVEAGRREGSRSEYEQLRAGVDAANQEPPLVAARNGYDIAQLALKRLVDVPLEQPLALETPLAAADSTVPVVTDLSVAVDRRPAVQAADLAAEARRLAVNVYRGQRWPNLYVASTLAQEAFPSEIVPRRDQFLRNWDASLRLELPIFTGLRTEGQVKQARAEYEQALAGRDLMREGARIEAIQARDELQRSLAALLARRGTVGQARRAWELAGVRFTNGMSTQIEVSDARLQLQTAEVNEVQALRDYLVAVAALERAVGHPLTVVRTPIEELTPSTRSEENR